MVLLSKRMVRDGRGVKIRPGNWALAIHRHRRHRCKWGLIWTGNRLLPVVHPYWL